MDLLVSLAPMLSLALAEVARRSGVVVDDFEVLDLYRLEYTVHLWLSSFILCQHVMLLLRGGLAHVDLLVSVNEHI